MIIKFKSLGHQVSHLPLLSIDKLDYKVINLLNCKGIIFTSANAVKFLDTKNIDKKIICFCVGSATEKKARSVGFQNVFAADGNVNNLKELILLSILIDLGTPNIFQFPIKYLIICLSLKFDL